MDVASGEGRFQTFLEELGYEYFSHDFQRFDSQAAAPGFRSASWSYRDNDFVCDILEIPIGRKFDTTLWTEVIDHVPDPIATLKKLTLLTKPGGSIVYSLPFVSLMHQAPFWFSSGLSPFGFRIARRSLVSPLSILSCLEIMQTSWRRKIFGPFGQILARIDCKSFLRRPEGRSSLTQTTCEPACAKISSPRRVSPPVQS